MEAFDERKTKELKNLEDGYFLMIQEETEVSPARAAIMPRTNS